MYYSFLNNCIQMKGKADLLFRGVLYEIDASDRIRLINSLTKEVREYADYAEFFNDPIIRALSNTKEYVHIGLSSSRYFPTSDEFLSHIALGSEIEFIYAGIGYFVSSKMENGHRINYVCNLYTGQTQCYTDATDFSQNIYLSNKAISDCWGEIQVICFL